MTDQLIIRGLLPEVDELELHRFISSRDAGDSLTSCTIIRDRETNQGRGFGFLQFEDPQGARRFKNRWSQGGLELLGCSLWLDYSRDTRPESRSWICEHAGCKANNYARREICYRCDRPRVTDFSKDTGAAPSQFLQLRDLPPATTAQNIVTALTTLNDVRIRRILLVEGWEEHAPIAFVEFRDSNAAAGALALASALPGKGFAIKGKAVQLSFIHPGVFVPVYGNMQPGSFRATNSSQLLAYWNTEYRCFVHVPEDAIMEESKEEERAAVSPAVEPERKRKRKHMDNAVTPRPAANGMIGHWSRQQDELKALSSEAQGNACDTVAEVKRTSFADTKLLACLLCSRKFKTLEDLQAHEAQSSLHKTNLSDAALVEKAHERLCARGTQSGGESTDAQSAPSAIAYRDRARERRLQTIQSGSTVELPPPRRKQGRSRQEQMKKVGNEDEDEDEGEDQDAKADTGATVPPTKGLAKGAQLLSRMGYTSGGLGLHSQGREEAVTADFYVPGAGLGAPGAKVEESDARARQSVGTYSDFVQSVKENARSRYKQLDQ